MSLLPHFTTHLCEHVWIHYLLLASPASNLHDVCTTLPCRKRRYITKWQKYSQNTTIFISYEGVDHIAVYNYMLQPLLAIVRLYYLLL
jgi:hypothetical protein